MPTERLHDAVMVYDKYEDEYIAVIETDVCDEADNDKIEHNQLYLILKA
jgi:hypothetical protein